MGRPSSSGEGPGTGLLPVGGRRGLVSVLLRPPCPPLAGRNEGPSDWSAASGHEIDLFFHNARVCVCVLLGWSQGLGRLRGGGGRRGLGRPISSPAPRLLPAAPSRGAGRSLVPCEQARDTRDGGANTKKKPSETVGVIYRHTHSHMGLTPAAVPPSHHTRGHGHTHTPALPCPPLAGWSAELQGPNRWEGRLGGGCDCLVRGQRACEGKRRRAGARPAGRFHPTWASYGICRPDHLQAPAACGPLPGQPARKGSVRAVALPTASQEAGEWGPAQQCGPAGGRAGRLLLVPSPRPQHP